MPIIVKDAKFSQTEDHIIVNLPLHNHSPSSVDVTIFEDYVKVAYPPHFFEAFLCKNVLDLSSSVRFEDAEIVLMLNKEEPGIRWEEIALDLTDKTEMRVRRERAMQRLAEATEERRKAWVESKAEKGRENVRAQMKLEQEERERIERVREMEKKLAFETVYDDAQNAVDKVNWRSGDFQEKKWADKKEERDDVLVPVPKVVGSAKIVEVVEQSEAETRARKEIFSNSSTPAEIPEKSVTKPLEKELPPVRGRDGRISVKFTPRVFPTPSRESQAYQEEEWLKKQAEARKIIALDEQELSEGERDPEVVRRKADDFYRQGNFLAAANAYGHALRIRPNQPALYSNRAACHLRVGNLMKCVEDTSKALELFVPAVDSNARERLLAHIRRGTALAKLELVVEGLADYQAALKLLPPDDPMRAGIERDAEAMRQHVQSSAT